MAKASLDLLQGTLDLLILRTLTIGTRCTGGRSPSASSRCRRMFRSVNQESLYPALQRLEHRGLDRGRGGGRRNPSAGGACGSTSHAVAVGVAVRAGEWERTTNGDWNA